MFGAIRRFSRHISDLELAEPARMLNKGDVIAFPLEHGFVLAVNADDETAVERVVRATRAEPTLLLPGGDYFSRVFKQSDVLVKRIGETCLMPGVILRLPHSRFPDGLKLRTIDGDVVQRLITMSKCPVFGIRARAKDDGGLLRTAAEVAKVYRALPQVIIDMGRFSGILEGAETELTLMRAGLAVTAGPAERDRRIEAAFTRKALFVCRGNVNRSAFAEALLATIIKKEAQEAADKGWRYIPAWQPGSAGLIASEEFTVPDFMAAAARRYDCGEHMLAHRPRMYTPELLKDYHDIIPMSDDVGRTIAERGVNEGQIFWRNAVNINDPMGGAPEGYVVMTEAIQRFITSSFLSSGQQAEGRFRENLDRM